MRDRVPMFWQIVLGVCLAFLLWFVGKPRRQIAPRAIAKEQALRRLQLLATPLTESNRAESSAPQVLIVDGSCPASLQALSAALGNPKFRNSISVIYRPQPERDHLALHETVALECARLQGGFEAYVAHRVGRLGQTARPILVSAEEVGLRSDEFLRCVRSDSVVEDVTRQAALADSVGVYDLPVLIGRDSAWKGAPLFARLSIK